jgi:hypothetical protein
MISTLPFLCLLVAGDPSTPAAQSPATTPPPAPAPVAASSAPAPVAASSTAPIPPPEPAPVAPSPPAPTPAEPVRTVREQPRMTAFRLSLNYTRVLSEDGDLTDSSLSTNAIGIDLDFPSSSYVRNHLGLANQWESSGAYSARGFRIDLISFGYPITLVESTVRLDLEPILTLVRGEIMFVNGGSDFLRMESGFGLDLSVTYRHWFLSVEPAVDFRYWFYSKASSQTGFGRIFPFRTALGHEF